MSENSNIQGVGPVLGEEALPVLIARPSRKTEFAVTRLTHDVHGSGTLVSSPRLDGFGLTLLLADFPAFDLSFNGKAIRALPSRIGESHLCDLNSEIIAHFTCPIDVLYFYVSRPMLNAIADECGVSRIETLHVAPGVGFNDAVVREIGLSLLPSLGRIEHANRLFMDHIGTALLVHLAHAYGNIPNTPQQAGGELAPWQQRRAQEMIVARLDGEISLEELALECDLSRSHFARTFRKTTGRLPHRWLIEERVARARDLLLHSKSPLVEIGALCGFANLSHFTRVFTRATGVAPGEWRRQRRGWQRGAPRGPRAL